MPASLPRATYRLQLQPGFPFAAAAKAVPTRMVEDIALIGPKERIRDRFDAWRDSGVTTMIVGAQQREALDTMAELAL